MNAFLRPSKTVLLFAPQATSSGINLFRALYVCVCLTKISPVEFIIISKLVSVLPTAVKFRWLVIFENGF
jgi:predicted RecA/RadA family phage recombinase